ncbi:MAG: NAD(P)-binding domain-containing protein [Candidatus Dormibacteria bacterium]
MKIAVLGTGMVGQELAGRLAALGHQVTVGTRNPEATLARTAPPEGADTPAFSSWQAEHPQVGLATFGAAAEDAELIINATGGGVSLEALAAAGAANLDGKVILDVANTLDFSNGFPPSLSVVNTDSLAEQIQRAHPTARVVKSLNTMNCRVMVDPACVPGEHVVFVSGDDPDAKATVAGLLQEFGWPPSAIWDLGTLSTARGAEMILPLWLSILRKLGGGEFNFAIARA